MTPARHRRVLCAALLVGTTLVGLLWRMAPLHLPFFLWKYGGSALWAADVYWLCATLLPRHPPRHLALIACLVVLAVELSRLLPFARLVAFRHTLAGKLLLGSLFSPRNIAAYWLAILLIAMLDTQRENNAHHLRNTTEIV